ncbi:MAG TPA: hypothetical protein VM324_00175 [Egibacteraceae bacterium]|nr:hypothetical protein [Egibacteraceae bacterium]
MKRLFVLAVVAGMLGAMLVGPALSNEVPPHAHLHVIGLQLDESGEWPTGWRKCHELANGRAVPLHAHHANLHTGRAGEAQWQAGNVVVPVLPPHTPWNNCAELEAFFLGGE